MNKVIFEFGGTIDKFIGDAVMVLFGAPQDMSAEQQVERATRCALAMNEALDRLAMSWTDERAVALKMRIGIHHGPAVVGNFGSEQRSDYTAIGPTVNFAARIESASEAGAVYVSESVAALLAERRRAGWELRPQGYRGQPDALSTCRRPLAWLQANRTPCRCPP